MQTVIEKIDTQNANIALNMQEAKPNMPSTIARFNMREARFNMIEQQIRTWEVLDPTILQLLNDVPRENFVPKQYQGLAFADIEIPLGSGQTMLSPKLEARILQSLSIQNTHTVLHVGTGSGYFAALLARLSKQVISLEINAELIAQAAINLKQNNIQNVRLEIADGVFAKTKIHNQTPQDQQSYDVIVYTASSPIEPAGVRQQLNIGGLMFIVIGRAPVMQATLIQRVSETGYRQDILFETCIAALDNAPQAQQFEF
jgi:protein-L-isoaspartate(D-aspartate) O-methyltransferase